MFSYLSSHANLSVPHTSCAPLLIPSVNFNLKLLCGQICLRSAALSLTLAFPVVWSWAPRHYLLSGTPRAHFTMVTYFSLTSKSLSPYEANSIGLCFTAGRWGFRSLPSLTEAQWWVGLRFKSRSVDSGARALHTGAPGICSTCLLSSCVPSGRWVEFVPRSRSPPPLSVPAEEAPGSGLSTCTPVTFPLPSAQLHPTRPPRSLSL